jgi:hypothetical protein
MHPSRQGGVQALGEALCYDKFVWDLLELEVGLERLYLAISHKDLLSTCMTYLE